MIRVPLKGRRHASATNFVPVVFSFPSLFGVASWSSTSLVICFPPFFLRRAWHKVVKNWTPCSCVETPAGAPISHRSSASRLEYQHTRTQHTPTLPHTLWASLSRRLFYTCQLELSTKEQEHKKKLIENAFGDWNRKDFRAFVAATERHGRWGHKSCDSRGQEREIMSCWAGYPPGSCNGMLSDLF